MKERCRHERNSWLIGSSDVNKIYEWCWRCGALRKLVRYADNCYRPESRWIRTVGVNGKNPYNKIVKLKE